MVEILKSEDCYQLEECIRALNSHHNNVSLNFKGLYPKHPVDEKIRGFKEDTELGKSIIGVIREGHRIVGTVKIDLDTIKHKGVLDYFVVIEDFRKKGYGAQLMRFALNQFEMHHIEEIEIHAVYGNKTIDFYKKAGFEVESCVLLKKKKRTVENTAVKSDNFFLRKLNEEDREAVKNFYSNRGIPDTELDTVADSVISENISMYKIYGFGVWAICLKETGEPVGLGGIVISQHRHDLKPAITLMLSSPFNNEKNIIELTNAIVSWTFTSTPFNVIVMEQDRSDPLSVKALMENGFNCTKEIPSDYLGFVEFEISRDDWDKH